MSETWQGPEPAEPDPSSTRPDAEASTPVPHDPELAVPHPEPAAHHREPTGAHAGPGVTVEQSHPGGGTASPAAGQASDGPGVPDEEPWPGLVAAAPAPDVEASAAGSPRDDSPAAAAPAPEGAVSDPSAAAGPANGVHDDEATEPTHDLTEALQDSEERHQTELRSSRHVTPFVGAASDVGHRHEVNQDAYRVAVVPAGGTTTAVLTIADGVSSAVDSDIASDQAAAAATRRVVGHLTETPQNTPQDLAEVLAEAFALANMAVLGGRAAGSAPGSCTLIAGVVATDAITVANVGDSRGYWVGDDGTCIRLSIDDSVAQARIDMGVPREQAEAGVHSHAITRWLGPDATDVTPRVLSYAPPTSGWLLVCSDGLWNYASEPDAIAALVRHATHDASAEAASQRLVDWALAQGGRDNVTVALARWEQQG